MYYLKYIINIPIQYHKHSIYKVFKKDWLRLYDMIINI